MPSIRLLSLLLIIVPLLGCPTNDDGFAVGDDDDTTDDDDITDDDDDASDDDTGGDEFEGDEPGECTDGADNDQDGLFDCDDPNCAGSPDCAADDDDDEEEGCECSAGGAASATPVLALLILGLVLRSRR